MKRIQIESESIVQQLDRIDTKIETVRVLMEFAPAATLLEFWNQMDISSIYHSCALEGEVLSLEELNSALDPTAITDATNIALYTAIRNHKRSCQRSRKLARQKRVLFNDALFQLLHQFFWSGDPLPSGDCFRKDIPLHRSYFHEINPVRQIREHMTEMQSWLNDESARNGVHPISFVSRFHYRFMHIFPFPETSGKVGRTAMNLFLLRNGLLPAIIHATERQRYYEAIRGTPQDLCMLIVDSESAALDSAIRFFRHARH